jgi:DNA-binding MarR family transcriptional regulator
VARASLGDADYRRLLALRTGLRRFLHWSETEAQAVGLTPAHHQLLLAIRGHDDPRGPTIGDVAGYLLLRHHSAVELVQRAAALDLVARAEDPDDRRVVRLSLTAKGASALEKLTSLHLEELSRLADEFRPLWQGHPGGAGPAAGSRHRAGTVRRQDVPQPEEGGNS